MKLVAIPLDHFANNTDMLAYLKPGKLDGAKQYYFINKRVDGQDAAFAIGPIHRKGELHCSSASLRHTMASSQQYTLHATHRNDVVPRYPGPSALTRKLRKKNFVKERFFFSIQRLFFITANTCI